MSSPVTYLTHEQLRRDLAIRDLSDPAQGAHAIQILIGRAVDSLAEAGDRLETIIDRTVNGRLTCAESLGHREFALTRLHPSA